MSYYCYIIYSVTTNKHYVGSTEDINKRLERHNKQHMISTKAGIPWRLVYHEVFETRAEAFSREQQIKKKKSRKYIEYLIHSVG